MMRIPGITHRQFLVLRLLMKCGFRTGRDLRARLAEYGLQHSIPAFYQMMSRLEDAGLVSGSYDLKTVDGQTTKERRYMLTAAGFEEEAIVCRFYAEMASGTWTQR